MSSYSLLCILTLLNAFIEILFGKTDFNGVENNEFEE